MTPSALAIAETLPLENPRMGASAMPVMRDFSQPWLDLNDKSVLITGGTGSFGKHFLKTVIAQYKPRRLIIFSRDELKQFEMQQEFSQEKYPFLRYFIGDVRDRDRLDLALRDVDYVVHAAAMKQVTTAEYNPFECIRTNVFGAENIVTAAIRCGVKRVVALSTARLPIRSISMAPPSWPRTRFLLPPTIWQAPTARAFRWCAMAMSSVRVARLCPSSRN